MKIMNIMKRAKEKSFQDAGPLRHFSSPAMSNRQTVKPSNRQTSSNRRLWVEASLPALMLGNASEQRRTTQKQRRNAATQLVQRAAPGPWTQLFPRHSSPDTQKVSR